MNPVSAFRRALLELDVTLVRKIWQTVAPHLPQPRNDAEALQVLHVARTGADSVPFRHRAYSHRWLSERNLPSRLPDHMRPRAERLYPVIADSVGISVNSKYTEVRNGVRGAMENAVLDCYANGDKDPKIVRNRMFEARVRELNGLGLTRSSRG